MTNLSSKTRKQLVLDALRAARDRGEGVLTADLENAAVGGTAGTARVRDLRKEGFIIEAKPHRSPDIDQYVYRLIREPDEPPPAPKDEPQTLPYVFWKPSRLKRASREQVAEYGGWSLWITPSLDGTYWVWRATPPDGGATVDRASSEALAKRAAILAAMED